MGSSRTLTAFVLLGATAIFAIVGHVFEVWEIPRLSHILPAAPGELRLADPRSITVAYSRIRKGGVSPWQPEMTERIIARFVERWSEATLGRSRLAIMEDTDLRDVLVIFSDRPVDLTDLRSAAVGHFTTFAGGRLRVIELYVPPRFDVEYTAGTLMHELGHALGCCTGPGTSAGHWVGINCTRILCSPHGSARTFSEDELRQMGLGT